MKKMMISSFLAAAALGVAAQDVEAARMSFQDRQMLQQVPGLIQQFDQLAANQEEMVQRLLKVESGINTEAALRAEIEALRAEVAELKASMRREQDEMRREIVADLAKRIASLTPPAPPPPPPVHPRPVATTRPAPAVSNQPPPPAEIGPHYEYVVEKGQTLSLIAEGFGTTVSKILAANPGLKPNLLRVGQKLIIPAEDVPQQPKKGGRGKK